MLIDRYVSTREKGGGSLRRYRRILPQSWPDLLGYLAVLGLLVYLLYLYFAPLPVSDPIRPPDVAVQRHDPEWKADQAAAPDRNAQDTPAVDAAASAEHAMYSYSGGMDTARLLEQLGALQRRPEWALLDSDIARMQGILNALVEQGSVALPAIRYYLDAAPEMDGSAINALGYRTLRLALFDVVGQIGGSQAEDILYRELQATASPLEIETLGRYLAVQAPGLYDVDILAAARERFDLAQAGAGARVDAGPLFRVFSQYGDASLIPDLENVSQLRWGQYGAIALSRIPHGAGLGSLSRWIEEGPAGNASAEFALRILAQSAEYPEAQQTLLNSVREQRIPHAHWNEIARLLMGTYHIQLEPPEQGIYGNGIDHAGSVPLLKSRQYISLTPSGPQVLFGLQTSEPVLSPEQIAPRLELIDALLAETSDPVARRELIRAENVLWTLLQQQQEP